MNVDVLDYEISELERELEKLRQIRQGIPFYERNPTEFNRWYNIDSGVHHIVCQGLYFQSDLFWVESNYPGAFYDYYRNNFGIHFKDEPEVLRRKKLIGTNLICIDPGNKEDVIEAVNGLRFLHRNHEYKIVSNNEKLFSSLINILDLEKLHVQRDRLDWYNTEIKNYLAFNPPLRCCDSIVSVNILGNKVYYSDYHRIWGFNQEQFRHVYMLEVGHYPDDQIKIIKRLKRRDPNIYTNLDLTIPKLDGVSKDFVKKFKFIDHKFKIVANSKRIFEAYRLLLTHRKQDIWPIKR